MTRINVVDPEVLTTKHLVAEYKEITQFLHLVKKRVEKNIDFDDIPDRYTLGPGHVKFFYDKGFFIYCRFVSLYKEMVRRGFKVDKEAYDARRQQIIDTFPKKLYNGYHVTNLAHSKNVSRILDKITDKPELYPDRDRFLDYVYKEMNHGNSSEISTI